MQDPPEHALIGGPGLLELVIRGKRYLLMRVPIPESGPGDRKLLVGQVDRAALGRPPMHPRWAVAACIPRARQGQDVVLQRLGHRLEPQRDQGLNHRHARLQLLRPALLNVDTLLDPQYRGHEAASSLCGVF